MRDDDTLPPTVAMGQAATEAALHELRAKFESGEITCAALRIFKADGSWEDVALGGDERERTEALAQLRATYVRAN